MDRSFWDNWATAHRNANAAGAVIALLGLLLWAMWETSAERVEYKKIHGQVVNVIHQQKDRQGGPLALRVTLPDGKHANIMPPSRPPYPKAGDRVPLVYERYDDGKELVFFDQQQWLVETLE